MMSKKTSKDRIMSNIISMDNTLFNITSRLFVAQKINDEGENKKAVDMLIKEAIDDINSLRLKKRI